MRMHPLASPRPPTRTSGSVHVRAHGDVRRALDVLVLALLPCVAAALLNTGHQANRALARLGTDGAGGWREALLESVGVPLAAENAWACTLHGALYLAPILAVAWIAAALWERLFARVRGRARVAGSLPFALVFALLLPPSAPLWQVALGVSFGVVIGKEIFGGTGMGFVHPAAAGLAFLHLAYPTTAVGDPLWLGVRGYAGSVLLSQVADGGMPALADAGVLWSQAFVGQVEGALGVTSTLACLLGGAFLIARGLASWRVVTGVVIGVFGGAFFFRASGLVVGPLATLPGHWHLVLGSVAFGAVFLATDPPSGAHTNAGRWLVGFFTGFVIVLVRVANPLHPDGTIFSILLAGVFAPVLDAAVVWWHVRRREARHA